jgi:hypothetical protein
MEIREAVDTRPESYWQRGCEDAKAGKEPAIPFPMAVGFEHNARNEGYMNGWKFGVTLRHQPSEDEGSHAD